MKQTIAALLAAALPALSTTAANDGIENGVHGYTPKNYVRPKEPAVLERLEWFKDQKLALMMCFGLYSNIGIIESWCLSDADARWSRREVAWTKDSDEFKRQYWGLIRSFNPIRFGRRRNVRSRRTPAQTSQNTFSTPSAPRVLESPRTSQSPTGTTPTIGKDAASAAGRRDIPHTM